MVIFIVLSPVRSPTNELYLFVTYFQLITLGVKYTHIQNVHTNTLTHTYIHSNTETHPGEITQRRIHIWLQYIVQHRCGSNHILSSQKQLLFITVFYRIGMFVMFTYPSITG